MESVSTTERPASPRRLSGEDAIFVHAETAATPMHTLGTMILDPSTMPAGRFDRDHLVRHVGRRIHRLPPFRQRLLETPLGLGVPVFADDPGFRVENHVRSVRAAQPGGARELAEVVEEIASPILDRSRPLWEMWLVEGLEGGRCAVVTKLHHCIIDGATGASQMADLLDFSAEVDEQEQEEEEEAPPAWDPPPLPSTLDLLLGALANPRDPRELVHLLQASAAGLVDQVWTDGVGSLLSEAPPTPWAGVAGVGRRVAFGSAALDDVKRVKNAFDVTLNDAVLAACALMMRRYLVARDALPDQPLRCAVPVSIKTTAELKQFSNKVSMMTVDLPVHLDDPAGIVRAVAADADRAKADFESSDPEILLGWLDWAPSRFVSAASWMFAAFEFADRVPLPWNCVVSNMRGAPMPLYFAGAQVLATYPMGPASDFVGVNITVLSNMGRLDFGVIAAGDKVDVWELADGFADAVDELLLLGESPAALGADGS